MTKKRVLPVKKYEAATFQVQDSLLKTQASCMPTNLAEEKEKFLKNGKTPKFHIKDRSKVEQLALKTKNNIRFELFGEAQYILEKVRDTYGNGEFYLEHAFGPRITKEEATPILLKYIAENNVPESLKINWCENLACSAKMVWTGPNVNSNRPELRKYSLWLNGSDENPYMRESGIRCLMDHEIGTHFYRSFNDGLQPWYADRERFGLRKLGTFEGQCTEEGLASIHTVLRGRIRYLWGAAMGYYIACKSAEMTFKELFDHLGRFTSNPDYRWKQAMRVKRGLPSPNDLGGFGNDQCYFEGAVNILRRLEDIDFQMLMMGKVCYDELDRIKRVARKDVVQYPNFMRNLNAYKKSLRKMLALNGLEGMHPTARPPAVYVKHLEEKKKGKTSHKGKKVRDKAASVPKLSRSSSRGKGVISSSMNRKMETDDEGDGNCEIKSFACSYPFINMFLREKPTSEIKKILQSESEGLKDVKELTGSISAKDDIMERQLQKLQDIVKNHQWSSREDFIAEMETITHDEGGLAPPMNNKYSESLSLNDPGCLDYCNCNTIIHETGGELSVDELNVINEISECNAVTCPEAATHTLCSNGEFSNRSTPNDQFNSECTQSIYRERSDLGDLSKGTKKVKNIEKGTRPRSRQFTVHRDNTQDSSRIIPSIRRRVLRTPVADLSSYDDIVEKKILLSESKNTDIPSIQKRVALNGHRISETEKMDEEQANRPSHLPSPPLTPLAPVNSFESLCKDRLFQHRGTASSLVHRKENSLLNKSFLISGDGNDDDIITFPQTQAQSNNMSNKYRTGHSVVATHRRPASHARPLSSGSERILKLHWNDIQTSSPSLLHRKPLQPRVTPFFNANSKSSNLAPIPNVTCSTNSALFRDAFQ